MTGESYEFISGHRRKEVCEWAGVSKYLLLVTLITDFPIFNTKSGYPDSLR